MGVQDSVMVVHQGTQYSFQTALAIQEAGLFKEFNTCFYYKNNSFVAQAIPKIRNRAFRLMHDKLKKRSLAGLDDGKINTKILDDILYLTTANIALLSRYSRTILLRRNRGLCEYAARRLDQLNIKAVVCHDSNAYHIFKKETAKDVKRILIFGHILDSESQRILSLCLMLKKMYFLIPMRRSMLYYGVKYWNICHFLRLICFMKSTEF